MELIPTPIAGAFVLQPRAFRDQRGAYTRLYCQQDFIAAGLHGDFPQSNLLQNPQRGTLRGLHRQRDPHGEVKVVRALHGQVFDVAVDMRPDSPSYLQWHGVTLCSEQQNAFYIPAGCLHGLITLTDNATLFYQVSQGYAPQSEECYAWNDPAFGIEWPIAPTVISEKDQSQPFLAQREAQP